MAPSDARTGPPHFVGVGAQRSGTTWWFETLLGHPKIRAARGKRKELHFFDRFGVIPMRDEHIAEYHDLFRVRPGQLAGEWTPRYMGDFWTPRLLHRAAPDARILVMLRDPIERYRSGFIHGLEFAPQRDQDLLATDAIERGRYATHLERLHAFYDPEQILVLQYERCRADPLPPYAATLRFLGLDDDHQPAGVGELRGTTTEARKDPLWPDAVEALRRTLEPEVRRLTTLVPGFDAGLWPHFAHLAAESAAGA